MILFTILRRMLLTAQYIGTKNPEYDHSCNKGGQARIARLVWKFCCRLWIAYRFMPLQKAESRTMDRPMTIGATPGASPTWLRVRHLTKVGVLEAEVWELPFNASIFASFPKYRINYRLILCLQAKLDAL